MKSVILILCLLAPVLPGKAASISAVDLSAPLSDARIGLAWNLKGERLGIAYVPVTYIVGATTGNEYATLNLGATDKLSNGKAGYLVSFGPRIDTIFTRLGDTSFAKKYLRFAVLPPLQITLAYITLDFRKYEPYLNVTTKFGGK